MLSDTKCYVIDYSTQTAEKEKVQRYSGPIEESFPPSQEGPVVEDDGDKLSSRKDSLKLTSRGRVMKKPSCFVH